MLHSPPTHNKIRKHISPNRITQFGVSSTEMHQIQIQTKSNQLIITQINQDTNHLVSQTPLHHLMETTLSTIVVYLKKLVFTHGQLYVIVSRVTSKDELKILIQDDNGEATYETQNIVYIGECPRVAAELLFVQRYF
jgi:hypothetical protein